MLNHEKILEEIAINEKHIQFDGHEHENKLNFDKKNENFREKINVEIQKVNETSFIINDKEGEKVNTVHYEINNNNINNLIQDGNILNTHILDQLKKEKCINLKENNISMYNNDESIIKEENKVITEDFVLKSCNLVENMENLQIISLKNEILPINQEFLTELIVDTLFINYLLENTLSLTKLNNIILGKFNLLVNTIFKRNELYCNFSSSILHEYLEDLYIRIYDLYLSYIFKNLENFNKHDISLISSNSITEELINIIASSIFENNILNLTINLIPTNLSSFTEIKEQFYLKYKDLFSEKERSFFEKMIFNNESVHIRLIGLVQQHKEKVINQIKDIIKKSIVYINAGKIISKEIIYDFKKFYIEYFNLDRNTEGVFSFSDNLISNKSIDSLINSIKYKQKNLNALCISCNIQGKIDFPLGKLINSVLLYAKDLKSFSLTEAKSFNSIERLTLLNLLDLTNLISLDLSHNMIGDSGIRQITDSLKENNFSLKTLDLSHNCLTSNSGYYLGELLFLNKSLEKLFLSGNNIIEMGLHSLLNILCNNNKSLKTFDISNNKLLRSDLTYIANLVSKNNILETLNVSNNKFENDSLNLLSESLNFNKSLRILYMNQVNLTEDSCPYFFQHLNETILEELYMDNNFLKEIGGILLSNIIKYNKTLIRLSLKKCELNDIALSCITKALESNMKLQLLNLDDNKISEEIIKNLITNLKGKSIKISLNNFSVKHLNCDLMDEIKSFNNIILNN